MADNKTRCIITDIDGVSVKVNKDSWLGEIFAKYYGVGWKEYSKKFLGNYYDPENQLTSQNIIPILCERDISDLEEKIQKNPLWETVINARQQEGLLPEAIAFYRKMIAQGGVIVPCTSAPLNLFKASAGKNIKELFPKMFTVGTQKELLWDEYLEYSYGTIEVIEAKSKRVKVKLTTTHFPNCYPVFITDTVGDLVETISLVEKVFCVTWGVHTRPMFEEAKKHLPREYAKKTFIVDSFSEILEKI